MNWLQGRGRALHKITLTDRLTRWITNVHILMTSFTSLVCGALVFQHLKRHWAAHGEANGKAGSHTFDAWSQDSPLMFDGVQVRQPATGANSSRRSLVEMERGSFAVIFRSNCGASFRVARLFASLPAPPVPFGAIYCGPIDDVAVALGQSYFWWTSVTAVGDAEFNERGCVIVNRELSGCTRIRCEIRELSDIASFIEECDLKAVRTWARMAISNCGIETSRSPMHEEVGRDINVIVRETSLLEACPRRLEKKEGPNGD